MCSQRTLPALLLGMLAAGAAGAQSPSGIRWPVGSPGAPGLQAGSADFRVPCGSVAFPCDAGSAMLPLYGNKLGTRSLNMQLGPLDARRPRGLAPQPQGLSVSLVGRAGLVDAFGVYGRMGTMLGRPSALAGGMAPGEGMSYGIGLSWEFSPRGSASLGWDSYDLRSHPGEREMRATSLGLQWRY
jgi:hypothetical protein